jgi:hypothetical protein
MENAHKKVRLQKIVAGGQTGMDRAALDAALAGGWEVGGWCPAGRRAEDGVIAARYPLQETPSADYAQRTAWNVRDSDGTLVLIIDSPTGGTALTIQEAEREGKPLLVVELYAPLEMSAVVDWLAAHEINVLNVAGPRESEAPGIYSRAKAFMEALLR